MCEVCPGLLKTPRGSRPRLRVVPLAPEQLRFPPKPPLQESASMNSPTRLEQMRRLSTNRSIDRRLPASCRAGPAAPGASPPAPVFGSGFFPGRQRATAPMLPRCAGTRRRGRIAPRPNVSPEVPDPAAVAPTIAATGALPLMSGCHPGWPAAKIRDCPSVPPQTIRGCAWFAGPVA